MPRLVCENRSGAPMKIAALQRTMAMRVMRKSFMMAEILTCYALKSKGNWACSVFGIETREVSPTRGFLPVVQDLPVLPFLRSGALKLQTSACYGIETREVSPTPSLQVLKDLHVYRKTYYALDKVRKDLNGVEVKRLCQHIKDLKDLRVFSVALCYRY